MDLPEPIDQSTRADNTMVELQDHQPQEVGLLQRTFLRLVLVLISSFVLYVFFLIWITPRTY